MSYKTSLVKIVLNKTPRKIVVWAANKKLKGVAELTDFLFSSEERKLYIEVMLSGEEEAIIVSLENFTVISDEHSNRLIIQQVQSNKPWMDTLLNKMVLGREWPIPENQVELVQALFEERGDEQEQ